METVYLALGSNVGDSRAFIAQAIESLSESLSNIQSAPLYRSKAVGYTDQPDFLNTVVRGQTDLTPLELLKFVKTVEQKTGRVRRFRWGPREIDIDIIFYGDKVIEEEGLTIPHARFRERDFVLRPLCDLNPDAIDPVGKLSARELLNKLPAEQHSIMATVD